MLIGSAFFFIYKFDLFHRMIITHLLARAKAKTNCAVVQRVAAHDADQRKDLVIARAPSL